MHPTSAAQHSATFSGSVPAPEFVRPRLLALAQPYEGPGAAYTLSYLVVGLDGGVNVIDPGVDSEANWTRLVSAVALVGARISGVTVTHLHHDHLGMAARVRERTGAPVALHVADQQQLDTMNDGFSADVLLTSTSVLDVPGWNLRVIHTPGHTPGSICVVADEQGLIFTGDHLLPAQFPGIGLGGSVNTNPIADYLDSLERVAELGELECLPGHEYRFSGSATRCRQTLAHLGARTKEVEVILSADPSADAQTIASQLTWSAGWDGMNEAYRDSALRQTAMYAELVRTRGGLRS